MRTDREKHSLRGPVKALRVETARFEEQDGRLVEVFWFSHEISFNPEGQIVEQVNRNPDGTEWRTVNDYDGSGRVLTSRRYGPSGDLCGEVRYVYDERGLLIAERYVTREEQMTTRATYNYDQGLQIKTEELDQPGDANLLIGIEGTGSSISAHDAKRIVTHYDERGEAVEVKVFNTEGALMTRMEITRDERGLPLEETQYVGDTLPFGSCASEACATGGMAEMTEEQGLEFEAEIARMFSPGTPLSRHVHRYDEEGRLVESRLTMMGMQANHQTFAYDEFGNSSEEVSYDEEGKIVSKAIFTREHDGHGNWTRELVSTASSWDAEFNLSTPAHVTRRVITYY